MSEKQCFFVRTGVLNLTEQLQREYADLKVQVKNLEGGFTEISSENKDPEVLKYIRQKYEKEGIETFSAIPPIVPFHKVPPPPKNVIISPYFQPRKWRRLSNIMKHFVLASSLLKIHNKVISDYSSYSDTEADADLNAMIRLLTVVKAFELEDEVVDLLVKTDNKVRETRLPFPVTFIDTEIVLPEIYHKDDLGNMIKLDTRYFGFLIVESGSYKTKGGHVNVPQPPDRPDPYIYIYSVFETAVGGAGHLKFSLYRDYPDLSGRKDEAIWQPERKKIREFVMNFLDFLYDPDIEMVEVTRFHEESRKAAKKGKGLKIPTRIIKVKGPLRRYINELKLGRHFEYSHKFWVRGHWRHLRAPRFKNKKGTRIWIPPFIKGYGILIDKRYRLEKRPEEVKTYGKAKGH